MAHITRTQAQATQTASGSSGLTQRQLDAFLDLIDVNKPAGSINHKRKFTRWRYRLPSIDVTLTHPGGTESIISPATRDISCEGLSMLHGSFVYPNSKIIAELPSIVDSNVTVRVQGAVVRCVHLRGKVHEVCIRFDEPIDARSLVSTDQHADEYSFEQINPDDLEGTIVYAEDSPLDQKLVSHFLRDTRLKLKIAETAADAFELVKEGCDLVLADFHLGDGNNGFELVRMIRNRHMTTPIVIVSSDSTVEARDQAYLLRINGFLQKPIDSQALLRSIGEYVILKSMVNSVEGTDKGAMMEQSLMDSFMRDLRAYVPKLDAAVADSNAKTAETLCRQISGTAPCVGFDAIAKLATDAADELRTSGSVADSLYVLKLLTEACASIDM